jgi:hypothetical protein
MSRKFWRILAIGLMVAGIGMGIWGFWTYKTGVRLAEAVLRPGEGDVAQLVVRLRHLSTPAKWMIKVLPESEWILPAKALAEVIDQAEVLLGVNGKREYVMLLQNNMELRPTGGFMGSYAQIGFENGKLVRVTIEDIYTPDGQIKGYVPEPPAISKYLFNQGTPGWRLRDANWHPDFVESAKAIEWFFKEGKVATPDGFLAITLNPLVNLLRKSGGMTLGDYGSLTITADNFYVQAQDHAETDFFPGSTQKRDFLASVAKQMLLTMATKPEMAPAVAQVVLEGLIHKELLAYIPDVTGPWWHKIGWDGSLRESQSDYLMINEANVGATKANCCIRRSLEDTLTEIDGQVSHRLILTYINDNPPSPQPPYFWGGGYKNYLRVIVPFGSRLTGVSIDEVPLEPAAIDEETMGNKTGFGFLATVGGGDIVKIVIEYTTPVKAENYALMFQKQTGIETWPTSWQVGNKQSRQTITKDEILRFRLK